MKRYNPKEIEPKWQAKWAEAKLYEAEDNASKPKRYIMEYFPYPSGAAMHVGHVRNYTMGDVLSRHARMHGQNVMHPMGWDAFGLPAENYAIKTGISPQEAIEQNTSRFKAQLMQMGFGYDWSREITSSDPDYYHWTQWFFLLLYKRGLAYQKESPQWWCPIDKTVLANEQVENGKCWRCGSDVEKKNLNQWFFKITDYAERLEKDLSKLDWSESIKAMQRNWIGRKTGINITYKVANTTSDETITVFTTRPDTNYGATFIVLAPEHPFVQKVMSQEVVPNDGTSHWQAVEHYVQKALSKSEIERKEEGRLKTGAFTGLYVTNPLNNTKLPIWVSDFVLAGFGTGAVVGVPAHDLRDFEFAKQFDLPVHHVVTPEFVDSEAPPREGLEFKERIAVQAIVKHPTEDSYLLLRMKGWDKEAYGYPTGGIDDGESPADAARRELEEETGFHNIKEIKPVGEPYYARFYHEFKKVNRRVKMYTVEITLSDLDQRAVSEEEQAINEIQWTAAQDVIEKILGDGCKRMFEIYQQGGELGFAGEESGTMINSGPLDGLDIHDAIEKMKDLMEQKGMGKRTVSYSIRDWLISRQRYWGAPIPIIHCQACKERIESKALAINFRDDDIWELIMGGQKTIETRADNPEEPHRRFSDIAVGDYLKLVNKNSDQIAYAKVTRAFRFDNLNELFVDKESVQIITGQTFDNVQALADWYGNLSEGYVERITANGLVGWQFELVTPGVVPVPEDQLPVRLPELKSFEPSGDGRSPLARVPEFVNVDCPQCGGKAERETDTMDGFACSSWYFLRFADPHNNERAFDPEKVKYWLPVDDYIGGAEHAVMHLLYARMWTKVMFDAGLIEFTEPFTRLRNQGMILAPDGQKMSKSKGNTIEPDSLITEGYGADAIRIMELFIGPWNQSASWSVEGMGGSFRFLQRIWTLAQEYLEHRTDSAAQSDDTLLKQITNRMIKQVDENLEHLGFNTAIAAMMKTVNDLYKAKQEVSFGAALETWRWTIESMLQLLAPFAPHMAEELWTQLGHEDSIHISEWPSFDERYIVSDTVTVVVQINGKIRAQLELPVGSEEATVVEAAKADEKVAAILTNTSPKKTIYIADKLISFVI